jgi:uncharacterized membrane-anchored protein
MRFFSSIAASLVVALLLAVPAYADQTEDEFEKAMVHGPADVALKDEATVSMPAGIAFVPARQAAPVLRRAGDYPDDSLLGVFLPDNRGGKWIIVANAHDPGFIREDESKDIDADKLLESLRRGADEQNKERSLEGKPELVVVGWIEKPYYDGANHQLIWSAEVAHKTGSGQREPAEHSVNYNTETLGRGGYISLDLVTGRSAVEADKAAVRALLAGLHYNTGKRYEDFNAKTDKIAEYGLLALIGGLAVKKLGLIALAMAFMAKSAKLIAIAALGGLAGIRKFFNRGRLPPPSTPQS